MIVVVPQPPFCGCFFNQKGLTQMFSDISELDLAKIFIYSKQEKIKKILNFKELDTHSAIEILYTFITEHNDDIWGGVTNKYDPLFDEIFFAKAIDVLKSAQQNGTDLNKKTRFLEPRIYFVR